MSILRLDDAEVAYGARKLLENASLVLQAGEKVALVGRNGAGKSTLLKVLGGSVQLDDGTLRSTDNLTVSSLAQSVPDLDCPADETIYQVVAAGLDQSTAAKLDEWNVDHRVKSVLDRLALPDDLVIRECSGGLQRRAMLARAVVAEPQLLLLDEPTNHLDIPAIDGLQNLLLNTSTTVVFVTHDRALIDAVATRIVEVDRGTLKSFPGNYAAYLGRKHKADEEEASTQRKFDQELAREEAWIREGIKARRTRNEGRVRRLKDMRTRRAARQNQQGSVSLAIDEGRQSGNLVAELDEVCFSYDAPNSSANKLIDKFSTRIMRGDRVGIIGANGSGKSTLLRLILGELSPQSGTVTLGTRLQTAYFDQQRSQLDETLSVRQSVGEGSDTIVVGEGSRHVVGYLGDFLFPPSQLNMPVANLSGGEKNRLLMAKLFAQPANLLVMDEPTNDLDVETLELLEELLADFSGTLLLVSHDRAFLDAVVTSTIVFEPGDGTRESGVREYVGGYSDWLRQTRTVAEPATAKPSAKARTRERPADKRLGYKEKRELAALPEQIEALEGKQTQLREAVSDPTFYQQEKSAIQTALEQLNDLDAAIEQAYQRWEALSELDQDA
ncbi:MAG: ATP-binding cassette domain-containing protein [Gammaproteobacteria bacterium]|nr:ATP-binding cassette domain-containing protein [Gammaproteobacteria bacterium]